MGISPRVGWALLSCLALTVGCADKEQPVGGNSNAAPLTHKDAATNATSPVDNTANAQDAKQRDTKQQDAKKLSEADAELLVSDAILDWQQDRKQPAHQKLSQVLADHPTHRNGLAVQGKVLHMEGQQLLRDGKQQAGLEMLKKANGPLSLLAETYHDLTNEERTILGSSVYDLACALSLTGDEDAAIERLRQAAGHGFDNAAFMEQDSDLDAIRDLPGYKKVIADLHQQELDKVLARVAEFETFPFTFDLTDTDGKPLKLEDLRGKAVIVDIWGTWCPPCRKEIPHFIELHDNYHDQGLEIVGLNFEREDDEAAALKQVKEFATEYKIPYRLALTPEEVRAQVPNFRGFPTTLFIDRTGRVRMTLVGLQSYPVLETVAKLILSGGKLPEDEQPATEPAATEKPAEKPAADKPAEAASGA